MEDLLSSPGDVTLPVIDCSGNPEAALKTMFVAVGDAALSFDPLSSQGILNALVTGIQGGEAVDAGLRGDEGPTAAYAARLEHVWSAYESHRADAYELERRWPDAPFWARRAPVLAGSPGRAAPGRPR